MIGDLFVLLSDITSWPLVRLISGSDALRVALLVECLTTEALLFFERRATGRFELLPLATSGAVLVTILVMAGGGLTRRGLTGTRPCEVGYCGCGCWVCAGEYYVSSHLNPGSRSEPRGNHELKGP